MTGSRTHFETNVLEGNIKQLNKSEMKTRPFEAESSEYMFIFRSLEATRNLSTRSLSEPSYQPETVVTVREAETPKIQQPARQEPRT